MINFNPQPPRPDSYAAAISLVIKGDKPSLCLPGGEVVKIDQTKLLQNYEAILHCAAIEQMLGEAIGKGPSFLLLKDADLALSQFAEVPASWLPSLGQLLQEAAAKRVVARELLEAIEGIKAYRDGVLHGKLPSFGEGLRKRVKCVFKGLQANMLYTPRAELLRRLEQVAKAKAGEMPADDFLSALETLYLSIEAESDVRAALPQPHGKAAPLTAVASIFELKRMSPVLTKIFKRDNLDWNLRASALIRNHLVHGSLVSPSQRQAEIIRTTHLSLGRALSELQFKRTGKLTEGGDLKNGLNL